MLKSINKINILIINKTQNKSFEQGLKFSKTVLPYSYINDKTNKDMQLT